MVKVTAHMLTILKTQSPSWGWWGSGRGGGGHLGHVPPATLPPPYRLSLQLWPGEGKGAKMPSQKLLGTVTGLGLSLSTFNSI